MSQKHEDLTFLNLGRIPATSAILGRLRYRYLQVRTHDDSCIRYTPLGNYFPSNPASGRVMEKCGFVDTGEETICPNLEVGSDRPVKVMKLIKK